MQSCAGSRPEVTLSQATADAIGCCDRGTDHPPDTVGVASIRLYANKISISCAATCRLSPIASSVLMASNCVS